MSDQQRSTRSAARQNSDIEKEVTEFHAIGQAVYEKKPKKPKKSTSTPATTDSDYPSFLSDISSVLNYSADVEDSDSDEIYYDSDMGTLHHLIG